MNQQLDWYTVTFVLVLYTVSDLVRLTSGFLQWKARIIMRKVPGEKRLIVSCKHLDWFRIFARARNWCLAPAHMSGKENGPLQHRNFAVSYAMDFLKIIATRCPSRYSHCKQIGHEMLVSFSFLPEPCPR